MRADISTTYLGMKLRNPLVASAGPLTGDLDSLKELEDAGIAGVVLPSLFEEQIVGQEQWLNSVYEFQSFSSAESLSYFPEIQDFNVGPEEYLHLIGEAKQIISGPVIASLNGSSPGGWVQFAKKMEDAGADAIELNVYFVPADPNLSAEDVERRYLELVSIVKQAVSIPVSIKIGAQFSSIPNFVRSLAEAGVDGAVLFNRYLEPDINLEDLIVTPQLALSNRTELRLPMRWIAILRDHVKISLAATSGIKFADDMVKLLLVGADVCMMTSALLTHGVDHASTVLQELQNWLDINEYESVAQMRGSMSYENSPDSGQWERANYMKAIVSYTSIQ